MLVSTPKSVQGSSSASKKTLQNRSKFLQNQMETFAGSSKDDLAVQTGSLLKSYGEKERELILKTSQIKSIEILPKTMVAMKLDMGIPWEKMKTMAR